VEFRPITPSSDAYHQEVALRQEVLRRPLGLDLRDEDLSAEADQLHFGLFDGDCLVACVVAVPISPSSVKLRQMAVASALQGRGLGRALLQHLHTDQRRHGCKTIVLHARVSAIGFYTALGYQCEGAVFTEVGIPHRYMWRHLTETRPP
jgi:predicted GNAT family N-acyltransferase